jgi:hypothetical protein
MMNSRSTAFCVVRRGVIETFLSFLLFTFIFNYTSNVSAEGIIAYAGFEIHQASIKLDKTGATSVTRSLPLFYSRITGSGSYSEGIRFKHPSAHPGHPGQDEAQHIRESCKVLQ